MMQKSVTCQAFSRRSFLTAIASASLGYGLAGCSNQNASTLTVRSLTGSIPPQILNEFSKFLRQSAQNPTLNFSTETQLQTLFSLLQTWKQKNSAAAPSASPFSWVPWVGDRANTVPDLVSLGNAWLEKAIQQKLIQPLDSGQLERWSQLPQDEQWQALVTRNEQGQPDPKGQVWGAPYRWGSTVIAYRQDIFQQRGLRPPTDWSDLWRSDLQRHISLLDQPREVIGLTLKKLGKSYNTQDLKSVPNLTTELRALQQQVKLYSSDAYLQPLLLGDTWVAVGWSTDVLPQLQRSTQIAAVVPTSGTALWTDLWVRPASTGSSNAGSTGSSQGSPMPALVKAWIDFCWQAEIAGQLSLLSRAASPVLLSLAPEKLPSELHNALLLPHTSILKASEFLQPLTTTAIDQYRDFWQRMRRGQLA